MKISIILPTYNEAQNINAVITKIIFFLEKANVDFEILIVDDNSPDKTAEVVRQFFASNPRVQCFIRKENRGLALSIRYGIDRAEGDWIFLRDSDGNHNPKYIPIFLDLAKYYEVVCGSRFIWGGGMEGSKFRFWGSYAYNILIRFILGLKTSDNLSGFVLFKKKFLEGLNMERAFRGFGEFYIDLLYHFKKLKLKLIEVPVVYSEREGGGSSKMNFKKTIFTYLWRVLRLRFRR